MLLLPYRQSKGFAAPEERGSEGGRPRLGGAFRYCAMSKDDSATPTKGGEESLGSKEWGIRLVKKQSIIRTMP